MIIKSPSIFYSSTFVVYPCPAGVIDFQSYNYINCKVPKKEKKKVNCDAKTKAGCINLSFIILSRTLFCPQVWPHSLTKNISKLCFPVSNTRGFGGLFNVAFWHLPFEACILGGEPSALEFSYPLPSRGVEQEPALHWESGALSSAVRLPGPLSRKSRGAVTSRVNILWLNFFFFFFVFFGWAVAYAVLVAGIRSEPHSQPMPQLGQHWSLTHCAGLGMEYASWCCRNTSDFSSSFFPS